MTSAWGGSRGFGFAAQFSPGVRVPSALILLRAPGALRYLFSSPLACTDPRAVLFATRVFILGAASS